MQNYHKIFIRLGVISFLFITYFSIANDKLAMLGRFSETLFAPDTLSTPTPKDRQGTSFEEPPSNSPLKLNPPSNVKTEVELDSNMNYTVSEKIGDSLEYRPPSEMTFQEFAEYQRQRMIKKYWRKKNERKDTLNNPKPLVYEIKRNGKPVVSIRPAGSVTLDFGGKWQSNNNPAINERNRRTGGFEFDQQISLNLNGTIGERLHVAANWDTKATFDFDNNIKISYEGQERDIVQSIEAGNVSMPLNNSLIKGYQNLFGIKTTLRFGHLYVTSVLSQSRGKTETMTIRGGAQTKQFNIQASEYDEFRHYFLSHFFKKNFDFAFKNNPTNPNNGFKITRVDVYITNSNTKTKNLRSMIAFTDLGESGSIRKGNDQTLSNDGYINSPNLVQGINDVPSLASNKANTLWDGLIQNEEDSGFRNTSDGDKYLANKGFILGEDFEKINSARKLEEGKDFMFHPELGYLSLTSKLRNNEALAVAFEYTYQGQTYKVGEMTEDIANLKEDELVVLKLLKPQSIQTNSATWDLMMKNIYPLNTNGLIKDNFQLRVIYKDDRSGSDNPSLQEGIGIKDVPLVQLLNMDKLNQNGDFAPDGNFDFIENATVISKKGKIVFPVTEPFGSHLEKTFQEKDPSNALRLNESYGYHELYSKTPSDARQITTKNKFFVMGSFESSSSTDIMLPGLNIAEGSVSITVGSNTLMEGSDYTVNYQLGRVKILNQGVLASGQDISIRYEKADLFSFRTKSLVGTRLDYRVNEDFNIGATLLHLSERPSITRVNVGDEPIKNTQVGVDVNYKGESRFLTKMVDKLPVLQTKEISTVSLRWEAAMLKPGHSKVIGEEGTSYLDDFEGAETPYDFTRTPTRWNIGSTPRVLGDANIEYSDWLKDDTLDYNYHRAKLSWYTIDYTFYRPNGRDEFTIKDIEENNYTRLIVPQEIFRNRETQTQTTQENILNIAYYPSLRGPYNYNVNASELDENGQFANPEKNWAAMTTDISFDTDFKNANIEFIEFWLMDPFDDEDLKEILPDNLDKDFTRGDMGGKLFFNLGDISEDVIPDGSHGFENGLPENIIETQWGKVTTNQFLNGSFDPNVERTTQDVGFDGLSNTEEQDFFAPFIAALESNPNLTEEAKSQFRNDPSSDDYDHYAESDDERSILSRYLEFNGQENNSPVSDGSDLIRSSKTTPDNEDLNDDKTLNIANNYFQYKLDINPNELNSAHPYVTDEVSYTDSETNVSTKWYQVRIPIKDTTNKVIGNLSNFQTVKFLRMYMTGFKHPIVLRMAQFQLVSSQWRRYSGPLDGISPKNNTQQTDPNFTVSTVNIEENGSGTSESSPYVLPPDVQRDLDQTTNVTRQLNEQSIQLCVSDLKDDDARGVFKNSAYDLLNYKNIKMFVHAHTTDPNTLDGDVYAFLRLGTDLTDNYYEVAVPLELSDITSSDENVIWPSSNEINIALDDFVKTKLERDTEGKGYANTHSRTVGKYLVSVRGNPDVSAVRTMMLGIRNPKTLNDASSKDVCVWFNELRTSGFDESIGWATTGELNTQLADFGTMSFRGKYMSAGYGDLEQPIGQRARSNSTQYGVTTNLNLDKLMTKKNKVSVPVYASFDKEIVRPEYNPLNPDVKFNDALDALEATGKDADLERKENLEKIVTYEKTVRSINVTNVRKNPSKKAKNTPIDLKNFSASAGYSEDVRSGIGGTNTGIGNNLESYKDQRYNGGLAYNYNSNFKGFSPFKKSKSLKSKHLRIIKDINFNPIPNTITVRGDLVRNYKRIQLYNDQLTTSGVSPSYEKSFTFDRNYAVSWNITKGIRLNYTSSVNAIIDEPFGNKNGDTLLIGDQVKRTQEEYRDSLIANLKTLGRLKNYNQSWNASYKLPINKIPALNWTNADVSYNTSYSWTAGPLNLEGADGVLLGNSINNSNKISFNGKVNMTKLYNKSKFLKKINNPRRKPKKRSSNDTSKVKKEYKLPKRILRTMMAVKSINGRYTIQHSSYVPGFTQTPRYGGMSQDANNAPGLLFTLGSQDLEKIKNIENGWLTQSTSHNDQIRQMQKNELTLKSVVEPFKYFKVRLNAKYSTNVTYEELYLYNDTTQQFGTLSPLLGGGTEITYVYLNTSFKNGDDLFEEFRNNRSNIQNRVQSVNKGTGEYGLNSQQVLIPTFLATYTGKKMNATELNRSPKIPLPNWNVTYSGLSKLKAFKKVFSSFSIKHAYKSSYKVGQFTSSLQYSNIDNNYSSDFNKNDSLVNNETNEYLPRYVIEQVAISEKFSPLIGINMRTKSKINLRVNWNRSRNMILYTGIAEMIEETSNAVTVGVGYTMTKDKNWPLIKNRSGERIPLKNPLDFKCDFSIRNTKTTQRKLGSIDATENDAINTITAGNWNFQLRPNINYQINRRLNAQLFFERTINQPHVPSSFRRSSTAVGIKLRFNLA